MDFTPEQLQGIKKQLLEQINSSFPEEKKAETIQQIESMNDEQLIEFLKQNNLIKTGENSEGTGQEQCIFCSMVFGDIPITKIDENEKAIAILELNQISEGHALIIPKNHITKQEDLDTETQELALKVKISLEQTFAPKEVQLFSRELMGHQVINVLPIYDNETMDSSRTKKTPEQLKELQEKIQGQVTVDSKPEEIKSSTEIEQIDPNKMWLPKRIP